MDNGQSELSLYHAETPLPMCPWKVQRHAILAGMRISRGSRALADLSPLFLILQCPFSYPYSLPFKPFTPSLSLHRSSCVWSAECALLALNSRVWEMRTNNIRIDIWKTSTNSRHAATVSRMSVNSFAIHYQKENICHRSSPECFHNGSCYLSWYLGCWASEQHPKEINTQAGVQPCSFAAFLRAGEGWCN